VDFLHAVASGKTISPDFSDGLKIINVLEAGITSAETKKQVILNQ